MVVVVGGGDSPPGDGLGPAPAQAGYDHGIVSPLIFTVDWRSSLFNVGDELRPRAHGEAGGKVLQEELLNMQELARAIKLRPIFT